MRPKLRNVIAPCTVCGALASHHPLTGRWECEICWDVRVARNWRAVGAVAAAIFVSALAWLALGTR